jgi:hypothetical protein
VCRGHTERVTSAADGPAVIRGHSARIALRRKLSRNKDDRRRGRSGLGDQGKVGTVESLSEDYRRFDPRQTTHPPPCPLVAYAPLWACAAVAVAVSASPKPAVKRMVIAVKRVNRFM